MAAPSPFVLLGSGCIKPKQLIIETPVPNLVCGLSPGKKACVRKKVDGNEDSLALHRGPQGEQCLVLADGHFGRFSGEWAVQKFGSLLFPLKALSPPTLSHLMVHLTLDHQIRAHNDSLNPAKLRSSTTLLSVTLHPEGFTFCSTGDSHLFLYREAQLREVTSSESNLFVGDPQTYPLRIFSVLTRMGIIDVVMEEGEQVAVLHELAAMSQKVLLAEIGQSEVEQTLSRVARLTGLAFPFSGEELCSPWHPLHLALRETPRFGSLAVKPGDLLLMASDGIDEEVSGMSAGDIEQILAGHGSLEEKARNLLRQSLGPKGGMDNLALWLIDPNGNQLGRTQ